MQESQQRRYSTLPNKDEGVLHVSSTELYFVSVVEDDVAQYGVFSATTGVREYESRVLAQAIGVAEQYDYMIANNTWTEVLGSMFTDYKPPSEAHLSIVPPAVFPTFE